MDAGIMKNQVCIYTVLATAKLISFSFLLKNEDAYFRERRHKKNENAKKNANAKKTKTHKNEDAKNAYLCGHYTKACKL